MNSYQQLKTIFTRLYHLQNIDHVMQWDESVMMPEGAGEYRAKVMGTLNRLTQKMQGSKKIMPLITEVKKNQTLAPWDEENLKWMEKKHRNATCIPLNLTEKFTEAAIVSQQVWRRLRAENNWQDFIPYQETTFKLLKEIAERKSQWMGLHPYDALLDEYAPGFNQNMIDHTFTGLKAALPGLIKQVHDRQKSSELIIPVGPFAPAKQKSVGLEVVQALGFDFAHGRIDVSHHPFCSGDGSDTRITTRYHEEELMSSIMGMCHETGHALYEQGLPKEWIFQPVGHVNSMAMHESQSLIIEMEVCRSPEFIDYLTPLIQHEFGEQPAFTAKNLYQLVTRVEPSLIRVDADEVTYPMHIVLRYELEKQLMNGDIAIKDLPYHWDELMQKYLGISTKGNDKDGAMQDVHWPAGLFGYFPAYTLGRMIAAQLFATFIKQHPVFLTELKQGRFERIREWLRSNIHSAASSLSTDALLTKVTGESLNPSYLIEKIKARYL